MTAETLRCKGINGRLAALLSFLNDAGLVHSGFPGRGWVLNFCSEIWEIISNIVTLISQHQINLLTNAQSQ